jgi:hypothetical protein
VLGEVLTTPHRKNLIIYETATKEDHLEDPGIGERIILKWIFE